jgi:hypothetical protein
MKKSVPALLIFLAALALWLPAHWNLLETRRALLDSQTRLADLRSRLAADQSALDSTRREQDAQIKARVQNAAAVAGTRQALAKLDPDSQWANPPSSLPDWNPKSPYIWVPKEFLARLHPTVFDGSGRMTAQAASVLAIDEPARRAMNSELEQALADYHALQLSHAQTSGQPGAVVTVQIPAMPEEGAEFRDQIGQILQQNIGGQRAGLATNTAADWLDNLSGKNPIVLSLTLHPDGTYGVDSESADGSKSHYSGITATYAAQKVPDYLLPFFADILPPPTGSP